ncbi:unnamed protein product [Allacma fusca]|uniref:Uncharacterized protein n=1 Tax=Allacma fusca TaxID=39272 RepID=A0A8J2Q0R5_9HEXA|nr:unnamed protein product [Allacma fusca]
MCLRLAFLLSVLSVTVLSVVVHAQGSSSPSLAMTAINSLRQKRNILQNIAVDRMLRDRGYVITLINCVLDKGPCDGHGRHLKRMAPEILRGHCPGCDRASKTNMRRVISHVQRNFPKEWSEVMNRFLRYPEQLQHMFG